MLLHLKRDVGRYFIFAIPKEVNVKITVFWHAKSSICVEEYQSFRETELLIFRVEGTKLKISVSQPSSS
jgi:hypothetical protein